MDRLEGGEKPFQIPPSTWHSQYHDGDDDDGHNGHGVNYEVSNNTDNDDDHNVDQQAGNGVAEHGLGIPGSVKLGGSFRLCLIIIIIMYDL